MTHGTHVSTKHVLAFADVGRHYGTIVRALQTAGATANPQLAGTDPEAAPPSFRLLGASRTILCPIFTFVGRNDRGLPNGHRLEFGEAVTLERENGDLSGTIVLTLTLREVTRVVISWSVDTRLPESDLGIYDWRLHAWDRREGDTASLDAHALLWALWDGISSSDVRDLLQDDTLLAERLKRDEAFTRQITFEDVLTLVPALVALLSSP